MAFSSLRKQSRQSSSDEEHNESAVSGEAEVAASVGSQEDLDLLEEDLLSNAESSSTGYIGRNSGMRWLQSLDKKMAQPGGEPSGLPYGPPGDSEEAFTQRANAFHDRQRSFTTASRGRLNDYYFYLDDNSIDIEVGDPHIIPPGQTAERLFALYQAVVHEPFRILGDSFEGQLRGYYRVLEIGGTVDVPAKWKAILNLVFAISSRYSHLIGTDWRADDHDHLVYMRRAILLLNLTDITALVCAPSLSLIQATGLLAFYYLIIGHVSRAWFMIGISIRQAEAVGLHLRNEDSFIPSKNKEAIERIWWGLHSIECIITAIIGRPRIIGRRDCTVPPPGPMPQERLGQNTSVAEDKGREHHSRPTAHGSATRNDQFSEFSYDSEPPTPVGSFFAIYVRIDLIMHKTLSKLYSPRNATQSRKSIQRTISSLTAELEEWAADALPHGPFGTASSLEPDLSREQLLLFFYYQSTKICITRPCLCRLDRRVKAQSESSATFNQNMAKTCIKAAMDLASLLPPYPNPQWLYERGPWWSNVHNIMQALVVLLLELSIRATGSTAETQNIIACVEKLIRWLEVMASKDPVSERAYIYVRRVLSRAKQPIDTDMHGWLEETARIPCSEPAAMSDAVFHHLSPPTIQPKANFQTYTEPSTQFQAAFQADQGLSTQRSNIQHPRPPSPPSFPHQAQDRSDEDYYSQFNAGNLDLQSYDLGQTGMPLVYNNPFLTDLNQVMEESCDLDYLDGTT